MIKRMMQKSKRFKAGYSLAEVLVVIAIIGILGAVAAVGIVGYLRSMTKFEYDNYAKEIYVAAQNHLTMAESQGFLGRLNNNAIIKGEKDGSDYYFVAENGQIKVPDGAGIVDSSNTLLSLLLPVASVDETLRLGGCYLIRYNIESGRILEVYFWKTDGRYGYTYGSDSYSKFKGATQGKTKDEANAALSDFDGGAVIGFYDGSAGLKKGNALETPKILVHNAEMLTIEVRNPQNNSSVEGETLKLIVTGKTSKASRSIVLNPAAKRNDSTITELAPYNGKGTIKGVAANSVIYNVYSIVLDDITSEKRNFYNRFGASNDVRVGGNEKEFIPGEDITVQAVSSTTKVLTNVAYSTKRTTNSLFASIKVTGANKTAIIKNIRHLENLNDIISHIGGDKVTDAKQQSDLSWTKFQKKITEAKAPNPLPSGTTLAKYVENHYGEVGIYGWDQDSPSAEYKSLQNGKGYFFPVDPGYPLTKYDGNRHSIIDVDVDVFKGNVVDKVNAGLFVKLTNASAGGVRTVENLKLIDFNVNGGNSGALAGTVNSTSITNVIAFNQDKKEKDVSSIKGTTTAGGLVGTMTGSTAGITKSAAAMFVTSTGGTAGGLVGNAAAGLITACYSGGHTNGKGSYDNYTGTALTPIINVDGAIAGGLAGSVGSDSAAYIEYSYSTCSVGGATAGGFAGTVNNGNITGCYATGRVGYSLNNNTPDLTNKGAFIGILTSGTISDCQYFEMINEILLNTGEYTYLLPVNNGENNNITPLDEMDGYYFTGEADNTAGKDWERALAYDPTLVYVYQGRYPLQTVEQLAGNSVQFGEKDFVKVHYGDWPAPETWVINQ